FAALFRIEQTRRLGCRRLAVYSNTSLSSMCVIPKKRTYLTVIRTFLWQASPEIFRRAKYAGLGLRSGNLALVKEPARQVIPRHQTRCGLLPHIHGGRPDLLDAGTGVDPERVKCAVAVWRKT